MIERSHIKTLPRRYGLWFVMCIWILAPYLLIQQFEVRSVWWIPQSSIDKAIHIEPLAVYPYFSFYLFIILGVTFVRERTFLTFIHATALCGLISHFIFMFIPTAVSREAIIVEQAPWLYDWLVSWDAPRNALPSFHASISVLTALMINRSKPHLFVKILSWIWVIIIFWSALAIRQHHLVDLLAGAVLASACWLFVKRSRSEVFQREESGLNTRLMDAE